VKPAAFDYAAPTSLDDALGLLAGRDAKVLAGGQSLLPLLNFRLAAPELLVDLRRVPGLDGIARSGDELTIGATVRQRRAERDPAVREAAPLLAAALRHVGHPQIRSRGTIGGSIAHADPAAELPAVLLALDGRAIVRGPGGERSIDAADFFRGFLETAVADDEILVAVVLPVAPQRTGVGCVEVAQRAGDYAACGAVAQVTLDETGGVADARVGLIGAGDRPLRARAVEAALAGSSGDAEAIAAAARHASDGLDPIDDPRVPRAYRLHLARVVVRRALEQAGSEAG
jgi:aerobic carbon-monoxide dehydrogenase medium subunit